MTKKTEEKLVSMFNEVFEEASLSFEGVAKTHWYILPKGAIRIEFDSPAKEGLTKLYYKIRPSLWTRIKEAF